MNDHLLMTRGTVSIEIEGNEDFKDARFHIVAGEHNVPLEMRWGDFQELLKLMFATHNLVERSDEHC